MDPDDRNALSQRRRAAWIRAPSRRLWPGCGKQLSWDAITCEACRYTLDRLDVPWGKARPWHTAKALYRCLVAGCALCKLFISNGWYSERSLVELRSHKAQLGCKVLPGATNRRLVSIACLNPEVISEGALIVVDVVGRQPGSSYHGFQTSSTASQETMDTIQTWLSQCCSEHTICHNWTQLSVFPYRLLFIENGCTHPKVKLVLREELTKGLPYATLSHRWGNAQPLRLTRAVFQEFQGDIPWSSLPKTFCDAILLSLKLGIGLIWIDTLCIIQDDDEDWRHQAGLMSRVYNNSFLNISADASDNSCQGLFYERVPLDSGFVEIPRFGQGWLVCRKYADVWTESVEQAPLNSRAWVLQERFLAPRVVHFSKDQVHWECATRMTSECLPKTFSIRQGFSPRYKTFEMSPELYPEQYFYMLWDRLMTRYTSCQLTRPEDRAFAVKGLATAFCLFLRLGLSSNDYMAGLWRRRLPGDLMWTTAQGSTRWDKNNTYPSWSWVLTTAAINTEDWNIFISGCQWETVARIFNIRQTTADEKKLQRAIDIRGPLCQAQLFRSSDLRHSLKIGKTIVDESMFKMCLDDETADSSSQSNGDIKLFLVRSMTSSSLSDRPRRLRYGDGFYQCLILAPTEQRAHLRRIGLIWFLPMSARRREFPAKVRPEVVSASAFLDKQFQEDDVPREHFYSIDDDFLYSISLI